MPSAGNLISLYAIGVVVGAPLLTVATARMEKRKLLMGLALLIVIGNAGSALAQSFGMIGVARFVSACRVAPTTARPGWSPPRWSRRRSGPRPSVT